MTRRPPGEIAGAAGFCRIAAIWLAATPFSAARAVEMEDRQAADVTAGFIRLSGISPLERGETGAQFQSSSAGAAIHWCGQALLAQPEAIAGRPEAHVFIGRRRFLAANTVCANA